MSETPVDKESPQTPEQEIRGMGRRILGAIDEIIEEHGWSWSKKPWKEIPIPSPDAPNQDQALGRYNLLKSSLSLGRRFDPKNHGGNPNDEAYCIAQVLENGIIPRVQTPGYQPLPHGILINFRGAPEFTLEGWHSKGTYLENSTLVIEELLKKVGFLDTSEKMADPSPRKTFHTYVYNPITGEGYYKSSAPDKTSDYSWISGSSQWGISFTEIQHPGLSFTADIMAPRADQEPPIVFIRYYSPGLFGEQAEKEAVREAEALLKGKGDERTAVEEAENLLGAKAIKDELEELFEEGFTEYPKTLEYVEQATKEILAKQETLVKEMAQYPNKWKSTANYEGGIDRFIGDLGNGSEFVEYVDGTYYLHVVDQQQPLRFDCTFLKFSTPEEGAKHPDTKGVETDNLLIMAVRDEVDQLWKSEIYLITPDGTLRKFPKQGEEDLEPQTPKEIRKEFNRVSSTLDTMINQISSSKK